MPAKLQAKAEAKLAKAASKAHQSGGSEGRPPTKKIWDQKVQNHQVYNMVNSSHTNDGRFYGQNNKITTTTKQ